MPATPSLMATDLDMGLDGHTPSQIGLLRDIRMHGMMAFFDSKFRFAGPSLREAGLISGIGDSTAISEAGYAVLTKADAALKRDCK